MSADNYPNRQVMDHQRGSQAQTQEIVRGPHQTLYRVEVVGT